MSAEAQAPTESLVELDPWELTRKYNDSPNIALNTDRVDPFWEYDQGYSNRETYEYISPYTPVETQYPFSRSWAIAIGTAKGHFITYVAGSEAFKDGWKFVKYKKRSEPVEDKLRIQLEDMTRDYNIKQIHQSAVSLARGVGRSLVIKLNANPKKSRRKTLPITLRVVPIEQAFIEYDNYGEPEYYRPMIMVGRQLLQAIVPWDEAVLYVHKPDPVGNGHQGIAETFPVYNQLVWSQDIQKGWAAAMSQRGISMIHFKIPGFELNQLPGWKAAYGKPSTYSVVFTDDEIEVKQFPGVSASFNLDQTNDAWTKEVASASGMAMSRIDGTQRGQVTGSATDSDNYYSILVGIQEENNRFLLDLYEMIDRDLTEKFDINYQITQKTDEATKVEIEAKKVSIAAMASDYWTYNQTLEYLDKDKIGAEGDEVASKYIAENILPQEEEVIEDNGGDAKTEKIAFAVQRLKEGKSGRQTNELLKEKYGSGMSLSKLGELRRTNTALSEPVSERERVVNKTKKIKS